ncbi:DUF2309 domain-containing protein (plasmid) [Polymorphobacter sp. PAMC 29334]|uniref:YbcC family protein n=1 Tax=Polymorphobacter sp. PAMC 29334 TaxID=2862331 RepID=UPI001C67B46F|nr:DUF2309 domain-containing protein [Polymorphobacter sp. PAMC 29334]QYE37095.1 DUF2309 domain-containing protein [Polymorphobacter sp. PAMC 29334]
MTFVPTTDDLTGAVRAAADAVPPAWPLAATVAVNPFLGQSGEDLAYVAARLDRVAGVSVTMPRAWYADRIAAGTIGDDDLAAALAVASPAQRPASVAALKAALREPRPLPAALPTVADLAAAASGIDWPAIVADRFGTWAAGWFDEGQALWAAPQGRSAYAAWRAAATHDLTPEILGAHGFAATVAEAPEAPAAALRKSTERLGVPAAAAASYFHRLLTTLGGWAQAARYRRWQAELGGGEDATIDDFLAIRLHWDAALLGQYGEQIGEQWAVTLAAFAAPLIPTVGQRVDAILQDAAERAGQRALATTLADTRPPAVAVRPSLQVAFCIDVRSEVIRRALEAVDPGIQTLGFAGFFGLTASHYRLGSDVAEHRLPVLLNPGLVTRAGDEADRPADTQTRLAVRVTRAWERFKLAAISSFAFVEAAAPTYVVKLVGDALGLKYAAAQADPAPHPDPAIDPAARVTMAATILRAMGLTDDFAPLVVLAGHGASVVNNPHASALHCGACGGYSGEVNARLLAALLSGADVRAGLADHGIVIPATTYFIAALHDTTTDAVELYAADAAIPPPAAALADACGWFAAAGAIARGERALRLPRAAGAAGVVRRSRDWAETRPEWALAGCSAFIAAPRTRTTGRDLAGRAFLHDYDWHKDSGFGVLELILTAPVVVASWISLQYYGSVVAPSLFGGGNKLIHNVVGGMGVVEGNGGTLRTGLPWQSVHDGHRFVHEPLRLTVAIAAPRDAMSAILERHPGLRDLFDNRWLHLFALDDTGRMAWRYAGDLRWEPEATIDAEAIVSDIAA